MKSRALRRSQEQERKGMALRGGKVHKGSGNSWSRPADGHAGRELVEFKRTDKKSFVLKSDEVRIHIEHALVQGRIPVFEIEVGGLDLVLLTRDDWLEWGCDVRDT